MFVNAVLEESHILDDLNSRGLLKQYKKAKEYLLEGYYQKVKFKLRKPKEKGIYSFRINKKYRAWGIISDTELRVFKIDDHQD